MLHFMSEYVGLIISVQMVEALCVIRHKKCFIKRGWLVKSLIGLTDLLTSGLVGGLIDQLMSYNSSKTMGY